MASRHTPRFALLLVTWVMLSMAAADEDAPLRRRRPGVEPASPAEAPPSPPAASEPPGPPPPLRAIPDRWRLVEGLGVHERWWDPYNQSTAKGDRPIFGDDWFVNLSLVSDSLVEGRRLPTAVGIQATESPGSLDVFGDGDQLFYNQNFSVGVSLIKGDTSFRPPDYELRLLSVANVNYTAVGERGVIDLDPDDGTTRTDYHFAIQELFVDKHLRNKSDDYDFDSLRLGIQPFNADFRGFLYTDRQPGVRLFGNFHKNRYQYNLAWFRRLDKDTNSELNRFDLRADDVVVANAFFQDVPVLGFQTEAIVLYNHNRDGDQGRHFNQNGFLERPASIGDERPHNYDVVYVGAGGDGHIGRFNLTTMAYGALGEDDHNAIAQRRVDIRSYLLAAEGSIDVDWYRLKLFAYHASGDDDPYDGVAEGFDAVFESPNFAGGDTAFWQRQAVPLTGGGGVVLSARNALLPALRSSKGEGQSSFVNPGLTLVGVGGDFDLLPEVRLSAHASRLTFDETAVLAAVRQQPSIGREIGYDLSAAIVWRPLFTENVAVRVAGAVLVPEAGLDDLYDDRYGAFYSVFMNAVLTY